MAGELSVSGATRDPLRWALDARARGDAPLDDDAALALVDHGAPALGALLEAARAVRDRAFGLRVTFSPKVFLPVTNLCRNLCGYCSFRKSPSQAGVWTMSPSEVTDWLARGRDQGCVEALLCLGDKPETAFPTYRAQLGEWGFANTVDYLLRISSLALEHALLPHTNAGLLTLDDLRALRPVNVSMGLMLESASARLCEPGMPHHRAPDKLPSRRIRMIEDAGELRIPFTTGILIGIGETRRERVEALLEIRRMHRKFGHIQEIIVQPFRTRPDVPMQSAPEPTSDDLAESIALARVILDDEIAVQTPPNLAPGGTAMMLRAGINDFGGISPVTPDYINPRHPWPHLDALQEGCAREGFTLRARLPIYDRWRDDDDFLDAGLRDATRVSAGTLARFTASGAAETTQGVVACAT